MPTAQFQIHRPHRALRYINAAIGIALLAAAGAVYWFVYRALPQTSGTIAAPVSQRVTIARDALGVPHISAASEDDVFFAQGYVAAQDRLFQMDGLRRLAGGDLSEIVGAGALELDRDSRRLRMRRIAEMAYVSLSPQDRAPLAAYARGVNYFIETHLHALPVEFTLLGYEPRPWSVVDTILIGLHMYRDLTTSWKDEILKRDMRAAGDRAKVDFLFPPRSGGELQPGSNAWAVGGAHTASGKPLLCDDMHLAYSIPGIWYMVHLRAPGLDVSGVSLPGTPSVIVGHNQRIAWGVTNLQFDVQDLYIELAVRRAGSLHRELRSGHRPLPVPRAMGAGARGTGNHTREGRAGGGDAAVDYAPWAALYKRCEGAPGAALGGGGTGIVSVSISGTEQGGELAGVHGGAGAVSRPRAELRLCRCGRQHRVSRHGVVADPQGVYGGRAGGWIVGRERVARVHSVRSVAGVL